MIYRLIIFTISIVNTYSLIYAGNSSYIAVSNQIARVRELNIVSNNIANANTIGYEEDELILHKVDKQESKSKYNSFVQLYDTYIPNNNGTLNITNRNLDLAITNGGYFKILTNAGERYTLNGMMFINNQGYLVNQDGFPFLSQNDDTINIPLDTYDIYINKDGLIYANKIELERIGVFNIPKEAKLIKEGSNSYLSTIEGTLAEEYSIMSGALRNSNVNNITAITHLIELQRSVETTNKLISSLNELEKNAINKLIKNN